jgi:hypothetical protein
LDPVGDQLVIDTVGIKIGRFSMFDWFGTPYTERLHLVERYRLLDHEVELSPNFGDGRDQAAAA